MQKYVYNIGIIFIFSKYGGEYMIPENID